MSKLGLIEYFSQFIAIVMPLYKPSLRGNLDLKEPGLISAVKALHESEVSIHAISNFLIGKRYKNIGCLDYKAIVDYFINGNVAIVIPESDINKDSSSTPKSVLKKSTYKKKATRTHEDAQIVFNYYASKVDSLNSKMVPTVKELSIISDRLKTNSLDKLKSAVDGAMLTPYLESIGYPLAMIFHACSKVNQLHIIAQRGGTAVIDKKTRSINQALSVIQGKSAVVFGALQEGGVVYDHEAIGEIDYLPPI